jgi:SAM-dependent methyltransferase
VDESLRAGARKARAAIEAGTLRGAALLEQILAVPYVERDAWVDEALGFPPPPPDGDLPHGAVPYVPCGVEEIVATVRELPLRPADALVDLGSGLGRVAILAHLLSGAAARGIELQGHLVAAARARSAELGVPVSFVHANAGEARLDGSVFFLYVPFSGEMLARVVQRLEEVARGGRISVCAVGFELPGVTWLVPRTTSSRSLTIYESR